MPTIWDSESGDALQANIILAEIGCDTQWDAQKFRTVAIQDKSNPAVRVKTEDTTATWANKQETQQTITVSRQAYAAALFEDIAEIQANIDLRADWTSKAGYSMAAYMEGDTTSGLMSLSASWTNNTGTLGSDPVDDDLIRAFKLLNRGDVPMKGRYVYGGAGFCASLLKIDKFTKGDYVGPADAAQAVKDGYVGRFYSADVYMSTLADDVVATNSTYAWMGHKRGTALIRQRMPTTHAQYVILETGWGVLVDLVYNFARRLIAPRTLGGGTSTDSHVVTISCS